LSLLLVLGLWAFIGGSVYRARRRAQSAPEHQHPDHGDDGFGRLGAGVKIPDTVPPEWVEAYRSENGG
jgi:hypothetical protein